MAPFRARLARFRPPPPPPLKARSAERALILLDALDEFAEPRLANLAQTIGCLGWPVLGNARRPEADHSHSELLWAVKSG